jgi:hypothetical protein
MEQDKGYANLSIEGEQIEIMVEGISVEGRITLRDRRNIAVEIISPFSGISEQSGCIPLLGLQVHNFLGKAGDERAAGLLCALYRFCRYVDGHKERLLEALHDYKYKVAYAKHFSPEARELALSRTTALENLLSIRKELKAGMIYNIEYQRRIRPLNKSMKLLTEELEIDLDGIFDECFNHFWKTPVWELKRETVLAYLVKINKAGLT